MSVSDPAQKVFLAEGYVDLEAAHAVVDHGRDDRDVERLGRHGAARNYVVVKLFTTACLSTHFVPRLTRRVCWPRATIGIFFGLFGSLIMCLMVASLLYVSK